MRMKTPAMYLILLILVCFVAGVLSILIRPDQLRALVATSINPERTLPPNTSTDVPDESVTDGEITILVLGVDHIADPEGKLLAVWLLSFNSQDKQLNLLGLPLDLPISVDQPSLGEAFDLWIPPEYGASFIHSLSALAPSPIQGLAVLDEQGFAVLLDYFGGVDLDDQHLDGSSVIGSLRLTYENPQAALRLQARVLESLKLKVQSLGTTPELTMLTSLSPIHAYTSPSPPELTTLAIPLLPLNPELISIATWPINP